MLQPRRYKLKGGITVSCLLFLVFIHSVLGTEKEAYRDKEGESESHKLGNEINLSRVKRDDSGLTTVLLISNDDENRYGKSARPSGVLTSTARTFVHDGTTTEYGTQVIGTTLDQGKYYAQILQTSSRIYFGSQEKSSTKTKSDERAFYKSRYIGLPQNVDNFIQSSAFHYIQPSEPVFIYPTRTVGGVKHENRNGKSGNLLISRESSPQENDGGVEVDESGTSSRSSSSISSSSSSSSGSTTSNNSNVGGRSDGKEIFISQIGHFSARSKENGDKDLLENLIRLENIDVFNRRKVDEIKASKASSNQLPTYTIRHDFAPSGFSVSSEDQRDERVVKNEKIKLRAGKGLFQKPSEIKYDTVTYLGFADFVTTVGSTVIVFMPSTRSDGRPVTQSIPLQTPASQKVDPQVQTSIKTFLSHSQGMITQTIPGHNLSMQTVLPTSVADRKSKGLGEDLELKSSVLAKEQILFENPIFTSEFEPSEASIEPSETMTYSSISRSSQAATEPLATFATTVTRTFGTGGSDKPLGLLKSIGGTKAYNGTTTHFTSLIYGTYVDGSYAQILKTSSSVYYIIEDGGGISATVVLDRPSTETKEMKTHSPGITEKATTTATTTDEINTTTEGEDELLETSDVDYDEEKTTQGPTTEPVTVGNEINKARKINFHAKEQSVSSENGGKGKEKEEAREKPEVYQTQTSEELITRLVPSTVYKTFTYLTTFFIPADETTTTSIRSREVVTSDVNYVTKIIDPNLVSEEVFPTSSVSVSTQSNDITDSDADEEFRLPAVRLLAPETAVVIEDTTEEDVPPETITTAPTTTSSPIDEESASEEYPEEDSSTPKTTSGTETTSGDTTLFDSTTETTTLPLTSASETTEPGTTTSKDKEETTEETEAPKAENKTVANDESDDEEVEVIFKTLFTTYTYLTTFFHESTTSISSSEVVVTNVITSTLDIPSEKSSKQVPQSTPVLKEAIEVTRTPGKNVFGNDDANDEFSPTSVITGGSETKFFDDDEDDDDEFTLSPSKEVSGGEVTETPVLEVKNLKTLYTTYTYYTTLVDDGSTEVKSRTEVVTNVVGPNSVSVLPSSILQNEALLKSKFEMLLREQQSLRSGVQSNGGPSSTVVKSSVRGSTSYASFNPSSTVSNRLSSSSSLQSSSLSVRPSSARADGSSRLTSSTRGTSFQRFSIRPSASVKTKFGPFTRKFNDPLIRVNKGESITSENDEDNSVTRLIIKGDKKDRTVIRKRIRTKARPLSRPLDVDDGSGVTTVRLDPSPSDEDSTSIRSMVTDVRSSSSKGGRQIRVAPPEPLERIGEEFYDDQVSSESNTDEIQPSPTLVLQTSYTTFTYFTTVYKGASSSDVISRLETVTNIVTETVKPEFLATQTLSPEDATLPITYFTTFTYWTTLYKDGNTIITSREETVSNVVTPTIEPSSSTAIVEKTTTPNIETISASSSSFSSSTSDVTLTPSIFIPGFIPAVTPEPVTEPAEITDKSITEAIAKDSKISADNITQVLFNTEELVGKIEPTTYYTTYTYFTTSYVGDSTVLKSRLETVTSVVIPTPTISDITENDLQTGRAINSGSNNSVSKSDEKENSENAFQTGLLSTIVSTAVDDGKTTVYSTDIFGTFIDGLYAKVLESTTKILSSAEVTPSSSSEIQKTGIVSVNEGRIVDADGISTTFFTTKAIGTSIEQLYAQVVESTTSVLVDNDKKSALASLSESQGDDSQKTGLLLLTEGSIIQDGTTTLYESRLIGTIIDGNYVQVVESTSSYKIEPSIAPSVTIHSEVTPTASIELTSPSPSAVEGSIIDDIKTQDEEQGESYEDGEVDVDDEDGKGRVRSRLTFQSKKRTFTPVIRPFASRNRPTFLPKKKPLGTTGAQTITRANFTPTITATLATKTEGFVGLSRNRFGSNRKSSVPVVSPEVKPTASSSRKFGRNRSSFSSPTISSSFAPTRGRGTSARVSPTPTLNLNSARGRNNFRTSSRTFNFESGAVRPSLPGSRPRVRPTLSGLPGRNQGSATATTNLPNDKFNDLTTVVTEDEEGTFTSDDDGTLFTTTPTTTTTEDPHLARRNNNPLLRFRRPLLPKAATTTTTTPKPATTQAPRRGLLGGRNNRLPASPPNTTQRNSGRTQVNIVRNNLPNRSRPANNLFPPRGLFKKPVPQDTEKEEDEFIDEEEETENENEDSNFEESSAKEVEADVEVNANERNVRGRGYNSVQIRPFNFQRRSKRQAVEYGTRKLSSDSGSYRYRRPKVKPVQAQERIDYYDDEPIPSEPPKTPRTGRIYTPRTRGQTYQAQTTNPPAQSRIRPTTASSQNSSRAPFTIREKDPNTNPRTSNFRRGQNSSSRRKTSSYKGTEPTVTRKTSRTRGQSQNPALNDLTRGSQRRGYSNSRRVSSSRGRSRFGEAEDPFTYQPSAFDGTITVTHKIPSEVTIPIVSGKVTEYRNVITAKPSIEILGPHQYTVTSTNGGTVLFLNREVTETLNNGVTEVTKFLIHETPTTSIIFTPTTIRGRKTSFSHIVPSTVYDVENIVTTIQPQIAANAPLANILLSQLLLGNLNVPVPPNQPLGIPQPPLTPATPTTEYKTRTTTYVTSVTDQISTVLPITFRGKEILTTIVDNTVNVITATEYITDTLVVTPSLNPNQQINSLLLPALLQAQLLNPNQQVTPPQLPIPGFTQLPFTPALGLDPLKFEALQPQDIKIEDLTDEKSKLSRDNDIRLERESDAESIEEEVDDVKLTHKSKSRKKTDKKKVEPAEPSKEIITLYVSGRRPGEFSTILSTVTTGETSVAVRKREAAMDDIDRLVVEASEAKQVQVLASKHLSLDEERYNKKEEEPTYLDFYVTPGMPEVVIPVESQEINSETQSLESVLGDVSKHVTESAKATPATKAFVKPTRNDYLKNSKKISTKHSASKGYPVKRTELHFTEVGCGSDISAHALSIRPISYHPLMQPEDVINNNENGRRFAEMRYNLATKKMSNGVEVIVATDRSARPLEPEFLRFLSSTVTRPITLAPHTLTNLMSMVLSSEQISDDHNRFIALIQPTFTTKTYYTTYSYKTTALKNNSTVVTNAKMAVTNVKTEPRCKVTESEDVEPAKTVFITLDASPTLKTEVYNTEYTYLNTFIDGDQPFVMSSTQTISNTLIGLNDDLEPSEVFPSTNTYLKTVELTKTLTSGIDHHVISTSDVVTQVVVTDKPGKKSTQFPITTNVTKTYFVTYTYFSTYLDGDKTKVKSDVSVSSDVTIEKFYIKPQKTETVTFEKITKTMDPIRPSSTLYPFHLMATRTYLTTFTFFTTLFHGTNRDTTETKVNSRTKVVENTVAETIPHQDFHTNYLLKLNSSLQRISGSIVATATLKKGETIVVTAYRDSSLKSSYQKYEIKPTKTHSNEEIKTQWMEVPEVKNSLNKVEFGAKTTLLGSKTQVVPSPKPFGTVMSSEPLAESLVAGDKNEISSSIEPISSSQSSFESSEYYTHPNDGNDVIEASEEVEQDVTVYANGDATEPSALDTRPTEKKTETNPVTNQTNGLLNFTSLGINGMNVLGPVFNAMAELINNKMNKHGEGSIRRNDTLHNGPDSSSNNVNPILSFVNKFTSASTKAPVEPKAKPTTPRTPVYIPVGSFGHDADDDDDSENQNRRVLITSGPENWYEKWKDIHAKNLEKIRNPDTPVTILEGGIPISPGQVITTNSDVIIGRPGESGPRPPNIALKNDIPVNMKPPPIPPSVLPPGDGDHYIGQPSTNTGVNFHFVKEELNIKPPPLALKKPLHEAQGLKVARPYVNGHKDYKGGSHLPKNPHSNKVSHIKYDSGTMDLNPPPVPPPPMRAHDVHKPITINHKPVHESHVGDHPEPDHHHHHHHHHNHHHHDYNHDHDPNLHSIPIKLEENHLSSSDLNPTVLTFPTVPVLGSVHQGTIPLISTPTPNLNVANVGSVLLVPTVGDVTLNPNVVDRSTGHPFLVNIQPSQVANVVIPHGSSTALIVNDATKEHSLKGEVIDDPKPHPEPETVGFVGAEPVLKLANGDIGAAIQNEVIPAETIEAPNTGSQLNNVLLSNQPQLAPDLLKPIGDVLVVDPLSNFGQNTQILEQLPPVNHQSSTTFDRQKVNLNQNGGIESHNKPNPNFEGQNTGGFPSNHNINFKGQNHGKEIVESEIALNYRKEPNGNGGPISYKKLQGPLDSQNVFNGPNNFQQFQTNHGSGPHNHQLNANNLHPDQIKFNQKPKPNDDEVYLAVPPPERPNLSQHQEAHAPTFHQSQLKESLINHQTGIVSDVPLSQVLSGSDQKDNTPLKDLLIKYNSNNGDSLRYDPKGTLQFHDGLNLIKRPANDFDQDLSPPPPPHRPSFISSHQPPNLQKVPQRYRPHPHQPPQPIPTPLEFMIPPPETPNRIKLKPISDQHSRPVIPIGAIAPTSNYPQPHPEDMVVVPHKNRPGFVEHSFVNAIKHKHQIPANSGVYYDLDVSDTSGAVTMEKGEEMQESVVQPMFPGQVINDVIHFNKNYSHNNQKIRPPIASEILRNTSLGGNGGTDIKNHNLGFSGDTSHQWKTNNRNSMANKTDQTNPTGATDSSFHGSINTAHAVGNHHGHHPNHRDSEELNNHQQEAAFDSLKISPGGGRRPIGSVLNDSNGPYGFTTKKTSNTTGTGTVVRVPKPNFHPSGFVKTENNIKRRPTITHAGDSHKGEPTQNVRISNAEKDKEVKEPVGHSSTQIETISKDTFFGAKEKTKDTTKISSQRPKESPSTDKSNEVKKVSGGSTENRDTLDNQNKKPYGYPHQPFASPNQIFGSKVQPSEYNSHNFSGPYRGSGSQSNRPQNNSSSLQTQIKNNRNRVPPGHTTGTKVQKRPYLPFESFGHGNSKRPSSIPPVFKGDTNKAETGDVPTIALKNVSNENSYVKPSTASGSLPSAYVPANESSFPLTNSGHNYRNKTINFYDSKPAFDVNKVHKTYNKAPLDADKWFASNANNNPINNNNNHNYNTSKLSSGASAVSTGSYKNITHSGSITPIGSEAQITLMKPPKATDKAKLDEVMGLSPPPIQGPARPQAPHRPSQRPKPHHKFEGPSTQKPPLAPIAIENDFPPVRSPDFNRKPFKPQDIFPPRLPDNFVHHLSEYPIRGPPKQTLPERPVTSLPIDVPTSQKPDKPPVPLDTTYDSYDLEDNSGEDDPYFAGSEINGHSKPIYDDEGLSIVKRPPPTYQNTNKQKPVAPSKPSGSINNQQTSGIKTSDRIEPNSTISNTKESNTKYSNRERISPTPTITARPTKIHNTKTSSSVTPMATGPHKEWQDADLITGSETAFEPNQFKNHVTPDISSVVTKSKQVVTTFVSTGSTTIFGDKFTQTANEVSKNKSSSTLTSAADGNNDKTETITYNILPTQTTTLTVTTTMTTVVHSVGHKPSTKTIVLTKTLISTVINKVTETKTLVKPTTSTLYQTHTVSTTKTSLVIPTSIHPTQAQYPAGTLKPEIFVADPHAKDTMTISVSSSMNKNNHNFDQKVRPVGITGKDSIMVVVSNDDSRENLAEEDIGDENGDKVEVSDEENEVIHSRVMVGGVFDAEVDKEFKESTNKEDECFPGCKAKRNELCQRIKGVMKCVCRPGFARMFPDRPCRPTYTYEVKLALEKLGFEELQYGKNVVQSNSAHMTKLMSVTKEGLDRMIMQSELRDVYHGLVVNGFQGKEKKTMVDFYVQLSENTDEEKLVNIFKQTLQTSNYSVGGTELFAAREADNLDAEDFNECLNSKYHDCSEHARCFNLKGTYTCSCQEGYTDMSENTLFPGRICSDAIGCEYCGYHGACYSKGEGQITCECFQWYSGERCNINLKVLLIALATIGVILLALLLVCGILTCLNRRNKSSSSTRNNGYLRYRGPSSHSIDRRAMISDSSSESSLDNIPYLNSPPISNPEKKKPVLRHVKGPVPRTLPPPGVEQRDRSVTVMIPRAKYRPPPHLSPHLTMSTFSPEKHLPKPAGSIATEQKLISYLDGNTREERTIVNNKNQSNRQESEQHKTYDFKITSVANANEQSRTMEKKKDPRMFEYEYKMSNMSFSEETNSADRRSGKHLDDRFRRHSDSTHLHTDSHRAMQFRKYSAGALVSAGYEVSAKVGMHQIDDDTIDDDQSGITNTHTMKSNRSQFTTLNRTGDHKTMSEARSYDETTVHPQTRSLKTNYSGSSPSSRANNDEGHTMIERDLGSTFIMPESQLFKPEADRGSDISNFDSL